MHVINNKKERIVTFKMPGEIVKGLIRNKEDAELTTCRACELTICKSDCMANDDLCDNCIQELQEDGKFTFGVDDEFLREMKGKYL